MRAFGRWARGCALLCLILVLGRGAVLADFAERLAGREGCGGGGGLVGASDGGAFGGCGGARVVGHLRVAVGSASLAVVLLVSGGAVGWNLGLDGGMVAEVGEDLLSRLDDRECGAFSIFLNAPDVLEGLGGSVERGLLGTLVASCFATRLANNTVTRGRNQRDDLLARNNLCTWLFCEAVLDVATLE